MMSENFRNVLYLLSLLFGVLQKERKEFPSGLTVKDLILSLLWLRFQSLAQELSACCRWSQRKGSRVRVCKALVLVIGCWLDCFRPL